MKIALVDDSGILRSAIRNVLESSGFEVAFEADGSHALFDHLKNTRVDAVLLDVFFPTENGLDILAKLKATYPAVKVLIVTGLQQNTVLEEAQKRGADGVLYKPFDTDELLGAVTRLK
ncbi:MAG: response regulator transcription factor [Elusimicrobiaceae bacterium]|nr:response regulator transcription factor [Elusimicrobiaceae bacterium]